MSSNGDNKMRARRLRESAADLRLSAQYADDRQAAKTDLNRAAQFEAEAERIDPAGLRAPRRTASPPVDTALNRKLMMAKAARELQEHFRSTGVTRCKKCFVIRTVLANGHCERCADQSGL